MVIRVVVYSCIQYTCLVYVTAVHHLIKPGTSGTWYLEHLRARAEPTKSSNTVPDRLQARQPTHLYDVLCDP